MKTETIMAPNFMGRAAKIAEVINRASIDKIDIESIASILKDALEEQYYEGYDDGYYEGYDDGHASGYDDALCDIVVYKRPRQP